MSKYHPVDLSVDTAYVLSYSTILLNTDAYNPQVKKRMTKAEFIKNNRGINDGQDLPEDLLSSIFDDIVTNEIRMKDEVDAALTLPNQGPGIANALANVGRDLQKEAYVMQSLGMANKTEVGKYLLHKDNTNDYHFLGSFQNFDAITKAGLFIERAIFQRLSLRTCSTYV
jgi:Sec7-like guanine-nucleotide exchange factor